MIKNSDLYSKKDIEIMKEFDSLPDMGMNRIEIIKELAKNIGIEKIGIAHCIMFRSQAEAISRYLSKFFEVYTIDCKYGSLKRSDIFTSSRGGSLCNPAGQADYLNSKGCELNFSVGLCAGHDMIFNKCSNGYVTNLFSKDFTTGHNAAVTLENIPSN